MLNDEKKLQTNPAFPDLLRKEGCYFRSLQAIAETHANQVLHIKDIVNAYSTFMQQGVIKIVANSLHVVFPEEIIDDALHRLGKLTWCSLHIGNNTKVFTWVDDQRTDSTILVGETLKGKHYREGDSTGEVVWDPDPRADVTNFIEFLRFRIDKGKE